MTGTQDHILNFVHDSLILKQRYLPILRRQAIEVEHSLYVQDWKERLRCTMYMNTLPVSQMARYGGKVTGLYVLMYSSGAGCGIHRA